MTDGIPRLRKDIEVHYRSNGTVDVRDPHLLQIYTLDSEDFSIAKTFDGSTAKELARKLKALERPIPTARIKEVADEFDELLLLDTPAAWDAEPNIDNVSPYSQIGTKRGLKVLPSADPTAKWTCHGCGVCCHGLAVEITKEEEGRIDAKLYQDILHGEPFAENSFLNPDEPAKRTLRQVADDNNACIFLMPNGWCSVHARQGMEAKPDACQIFPAMVLMIPGQEPRLGIRTNCSSMYQSFEDGPPVKDMTDHVMRIIGDRGEVHKAPKEVKLFKRKAPFAKLDALCTHARTIFDEGGVNADTILLFDSKFLGGRVKKSMKAYGRAMLKYMEKEQSGPAPVEEGAYHQQLKRLTRGHYAIEQMKAGRLPPPPSKRVDAFLRAQIGHVLHIVGPLNLPDAGYALVGEMLSMLGMLHAIGKGGSLKTANTAFEVFMMPLLESMEHAWPILDAIDPKYAEALRDEVSE